MEGNTWKPACVFQRVFLSHENNTVVGIIVVVVVIIVLIVLFPFFSLYYYCYYHHHSSAASGSCTCKFNSGSHTLISWSLSTSTNRQLDLFPTLFCEINIVTWWWQCKFHASKVVDEAIFNYYFLLFQWIRMNVWWPECKRCHWITISLWNKKWGLPLTPSLASTVNIIWWQIFSPSAINK